MPTTVSNVRPNGNSRNPSGLNPRPNPEKRYVFREVWNRVLSVDEEDRAQSPEPDAGQRRRYPPSIPQLQAFFGIRNGVSPRLRAICDTGDQALILNQLLCYWFSRDGQNSIRARVMKKIDNSRQRCVAKSYGEWSEELGMTARQARTAIEGLRRKGLVQTKVFKFNNIPTLHIYPARSAIAEASGCTRDQQPYRRESRRGNRLNNGQREAQQAMIAYLDMLGVDLPNEGRL